MARNLKSKLKMPTKPMADRAAEEEVDMDIADLDMLAAEDPEAMIEEEEDGLDMAELEEPGMLQDISDDELLAEAIARGLMPEPELEDEDIEAELEEEEEELA